VPEVYVPWFQSSGTGGVTFVVRTATPPLGLAESVQEAIWAVDPGKAVWAMRSMETLLADWTRERRFNTALLLSFSWLALFLAGIGVYGLVSWGVAERVAEMGVRRALGADRGAILRVVLLRGLTLAAAGTGLGLAAAVVATRLLRGLLFGVGPLDPLTFAAVSCVVLGTAVLAALVPARRATRIDPMVALRAE
jgi:ABC-type antimicrobial peptide transport system permease subunit